MALQEIKLDEVYVAYAMNGNSGVIYSLQVERQQRRQGIGTAVYKEIERKAKESGVELIVLDVFEHNPAGKAFWAAQGFRYEGPSSSDGYGEWVKYL